MLNIIMLESPATTTRTTSKRGSVKEEEIAAAELALKAHVLRSNREIVAEVTEGDRMMQEIVDMVDLTEAPEEAVASLVMDLLRYCERERIDWTEDVMSRALERFGSERAYAVQNR